MATATTTGMVTQQPDSLKLSATLCVLRNLHKVAEEIEVEYGDKSAENAFFHCGIQGKVTKHSADRDYDYFLAKAAEVREHLEDNLVHNQIAELASTALEIYNRCENRRRMGFEIVVLSFLVNSRSSWLEIPEKYHSKTFVMDMLVSCRHRFQKVSKAYFWSRQSESLLTSTLATTRNLTRIKLPSVGDALLRCLAVNCRKLLDVELQFAPDVTDGGLLAFVGKAIERKDLGNPRRWPRALNRQTDFGAHKDWFVKDSLLFTPPAQSPSTSYECSPTLTHCLPYMRDTGFGCREIVSLRINGEFTFPGAAGQPPNGQIAESFDHLKVNGGRNAKSAPILELGVYGVLLFLKKLLRVKMPALPTAIARLSKLVDEDVRLSLQSMTFGGRDLLTIGEVAGIARLCGEALSDVVNFSPDCMVPAPMDDADNVFMVHNGGGVVADRNFSSSACRAATHFAHVRSFSGRLSFACFVNFARVNGGNLARLHLSSAAVFDLADILLLRKFAPNLEAIEGSFNIRTDEDSFFPPHHRHDSDAGIPMEFGLWLEAGTGPFSPELKKLLAECPMRHLRIVDVEGRLTLMAMQLIAGNAERLEQLHVANSTLAREAAAGDPRVIISDEWIDGLIHVGALQRSLRRLALRMSRVETADAGGFTEAGLLKLLDHCAGRCPKVGEIVGEFTRVPDLKLAAFVEKYAEEGLRGLSVRNAVPYRRFDNDYDSDRYYGMNEGYRELLRRQQEEVALAGAVAVAGMGEQEPLQQQQQHANSWWRRGNAGGAGAGGAGRRCLRWEGYVFRPFEK